MLSSDITRSTYLQSVETCFWHYRGTTHTVDFLIILGLMAAHRPPTLLDISPCISLTLFPVITCLLEMLPGMQSLSPASSHAITRPFAQYRPFPCYRYRRSVRTL